MILLLSKVIDFNKARHELYEMICNSIPDYEGKICIPLSGGLDSRVIAAIIAKKRQIELSYCQFYLPYPIKQAKHIEAPGYARAIAKILKIKEFYAVCVNKETEWDRQIIKSMLGYEKLKRSRMFTGLRLLNERLDVSEYTFVVGHGLDVLTGNAVNPLTLVNSKYADVDVETVETIMPNNFELNKAAYTYFGKSVSHPVWNDKLIDYCLNLPIKYRFHQRLYRSMIKEFLPEVASIPREGMLCRTDTGDVRYFYDRTKYYFKKKLKGKVGVV